MLTLEVEWLMGACRATRDPADPAAEWPVQPDRIFSALVASWGLTGEDRQARAALEWLEALPPPRLSAVPFAGADDRDLPRAHPRTVVTVFVPPNDPGPTDIRVLPERRRRQPRSFPAVALPPGVQLRLAWEADAPPATLAGLDRLARDTSYIGHSTSLVRCCFTSAAVLDQGLAFAPTLAAPARGRLAELAALHARRRAGDERARPRPWATLRPIQPVRSESPASVFGARWIVLAHAGGDRPDARAAALVARTLHDGLKAAYPDPSPDWLNGHDAEGGPSKAPHLAIAPMLNAGWDHADGALMGLALVLPRAVEAALGADTPAAFDEAQRLAAAVARMEPLGWRPGRRWTLARPLDDALRSLDPRRYARAATRWSTVTPIALDRYPKSDDPAEAIIARACANIGLPAPVAVRTHKHGAVSGAPSAWPAGGAPAWTGWARPKSLAGRPLVHATLEFAEPVRGPVMLGAGRFFGLGLCLPIGEP